MTAKTVCDFLHCEAEDSLIIVVEHDGRQWGLCPLHDRIVSKNGASIEREGGTDYLFSPVMMRGKSD